MNPSLRDERLQAWRSLGFLVACLCAPVYLPGRDHLPALTFQLYLAPFTLGLGLGLWLSLAPLPEGLLKLGLPGWPGRLAAMAFALLTAGYAMHQAQLPRYAPYGYLSLARPLIVLSSLVLLGCLALWRRRRQTTGPWLSLLLLAGAGGLVLSILYYPLARERSDMLFLLEHGGQAWLKGGSLTEAYQAPPAVKLTYLPGLWLSYLPATALGLDLRWLSLAFSLAATALLWSAAPIPRRGLVLSLLAAFWLSPWFQFRHEAYIHGLLLPAALAGWGLLKGRPWVAVAALAWMATQSQLAWFILPFVLWHVRLKQGWGAALGAGALVAAAWALVVGPYIYYDGADLRANVFGTFTGQAEMPGPNLGYWLSLGLGLKGLRGLQALALVALFFWSAKGLADAGKVLRAAALALFLFIGLNNLVRDYFFFLPLLLLAFSLAAAPLKTKKA